MMETEQKRTVHFDNQALRARVAMFAMISASQSELSLVSSYGPTVKQRKKNKKFTCIQCGVSIPPGKHNRKCKDCLNDNFGIT